MPNPLGGRHFVVVGPKGGDGARWHLTECELFSTATGGRVIEIHDPGCEVRIVGAPDVVLDWLTAAMAVVLEHQLAGEGDRP
jgi:hypothetical protein